MSTPWRNPVRPTVVEVDLRALAENLRCLRRTIGERVGVIAVVKADAYGHGAVVVGRLLEGLGIWGLGVATVEEGIELRENGVRVPILVMGAAFGDEHRQVIEHDLTPVVGDEGDIDRFAEQARRSGRVRFSIHVKVDSGMTRLGVTTSQFDRFIRHCTAQPSIRVDGLMTHLGCAEEVDPTPTERQLDLFARCLDHARAVGADPQLIHAANSAAALRFPGSRYDLVRVGIALYGAMPSEHVPDPGVRPVLSWRTRINAIRDVPAGTHVSYGATYVTRRPSRVATLPVGYADGYPRAVGNRAQVVIHGHRAPVVGRVCMDLCMIDVTDIGPARVGDSVSLIGGQSGGDEIVAIHPDELAQWAETISYEVLSRISRRVPRTYPGMPDSEHAYVAR